MAKDSDIIIKYRTMNMFHWDFKLVPVTYEV